MKKAAIYAILLQLMTISCSDNSSAATIRGRWQLRETIYPARTATTDSVFYSFDSGVLQLQTLLPRNHESERSYGQYRIEGDSIIMTIPDTYFGQAAANEHYDWQTNERRFAIRTLTNTKLELSVNSTRTGADTIYTFRKYH